MGHVILIQQIVSNFEVTATSGAPPAGAHVRHSTRAAHVMCEVGSSVNEVIAVFDDDYKIISMLATLHHMVMVVKWVLIREMGFKTAISSSLEDPTSHLTRPAP